MQCGTEQGAHNHLGASAISTNFFKVQVEQEQTFGLVPQGKEQGKKKEINIRAVLS